MSSCFNLILDTSVPSIIVNVHNPSVLNHPCYITIASNEPLDLWHNFKVIDKDGGIEELVLSRSEDKKSFTGFFIPIKLGIYTLQASFRDEVFNVVSFTNSVNIVPSSVLGIRISHSNLATKDNRVPKPLRCSSKAFFHKVSDRPMKINVTHSLNY